MLHSKSYYLSLDLKNAVGQLYKEIEELERKQKEFEKRLDNVEDLVEE